MFASAPPTFPAFPPAFSAPPFGAGPAQFPASIMRAPPAYPGIPVGAPYFGGQGAPMYPNTFPMAPATIPVVPVPPLLPQNTFPATVGAPMLPYGPQLSVQSPPPPLPPLPPPPPATSQPPLYPVIGIGQQMPENVVYRDVPVPVEQIREEIVEVPREVRIPRPVHAEPTVVECPVPVEQIVEKIVQVPVPQYKKVTERVEVPHPILKYIDRPEPYPVEKIVEHRVPAPYTKVVEKPVPYPVQKFVEKRVEVPVDVKVKQEVHVPVTVKKYVDRPVKYYVDKYEEEYVPVVVTKVVHKHVEVPEYVDVAEPVHVDVDRIVQRQMPFPMVRDVPQMIPRPFPTPYDIPVPVPVGVPVPFNRVRYQDVPVLQEQTVEQVTHVPVTRQVTVPDIRHVPVAVEKVIQVPRPFPVQKVVTREEEKIVHVPVEVPIIVEHQQHVVQPVHVVEEPVTHMAQRLVPGEPYVEGETLQQRVPPMMMNPTTVPQASTSVLVPATAPAYPPIPVPPNAATTSYDVYPGSQPSFGSSTRRGGGGPLNLPPGYTLVSEEYRRVR